MSFFPLQTGRRCFNWQHSQIVHILRKWVILLPRVQQSYAIVSRLKPEKQPPSKKKTRLCHPKKILFAIMGEDRESISPDESEELWVFFGGAGTMNFSKLKWEVLLCLMNSSGSVGFIHYASARAAVPLIRSVEEGREEKRKQLSGIDGSCVKVSIFHRKASSPPPPFTAPMNLVMGFTVQLCDGG